jgi:Putative small multi-drug export protein
LVSGIEELSIINILMELLIKLLSTFVAGAFWLWWAIPTGMVMDLPPLISGAAATLGNLGAVLFVVVLNEQLRRWSIYSRLATKQGERLKQVWSSYGLPGVALLSPLLTGAPLGTALALLFGAPPRPLLCWMTVSVVLWGASLTVAATFGWSVLRG